jgi:hypothetical protein
VTYSQNPGTLFPVGSTTVTATATDAANNTDICTFTVTVTDNESPDITCPANITQTADAGVCGAIVTFAASATDNCSAVVTYSQNPGTLFPVGSTTVTATATDAANNTDICTFTVTVTDNESPDITCPANISQTADAGVCGAIVTFAASATDNCSAVVTYSQNPGTLFPVGSTTVTATATDAANNTDICTFTVTITDNENPTITCPTPANPYTVSSGCTWTGSGLAPVSIGDNCGTPALSYSINGGAFVAGGANGYAFPIGTTGVVYKVTDASGNTTTCSFSITVQGVTVSGVINYLNTPLTSMNNVVVTLRQGTTDVYSATTNATGNYIITGVCEGDYDVVFNTIKPVGGINSSDAAQVNAWGVGPQYTIEKVRFFAGDVIRNNFLSSSDAGQILNYFVTGGATPFNPRWTFWRAGETTITQNPLPNVLTINVAAGSAPITQNYYGMVTGDFNMSFVPGGAKSVMENVTLNIGGTTLIEHGVEFELPVTTGTVMEVGAVSLIMDFPTDQLEVTGVYLGTDPTSPMEYAVVGNELRIGWNALFPMSLNTGEALLTLKLRTIGSMAQGETIRLSLTSDPLNELADGEYNTIPNAQLFVDEIGGTITGIPEVLINGKLILENHPNPFAGRTTFTYILPEDGKVMLEIADVTGSKTDVLMDEWQQAGAHTFSADMSNYAVGVYTATIRLKGKSDVNTRTIKIIRTK